MAIRRFESNGRFSNVVEHNGILYIAGQLCSDPTGGIKEQTSEVLEKIDSLLSRYGSDKEHLLTATVYIKDTALFKGMNCVWDSWVGKDNEPTRACVEASLASPTFLVEIAATAAVI